MPKLKTRAEKLEEVFAGAFRDVNQDAVGDVCAGILDIPDSYHSIFEEILPRLRNVSPLTYNRLLDDLFELRSHFEHIRSHAESAVAGVDRLILELQDKE